MKQKEEPRYQIMVNGEPREEPFFTSVCAIARAEGIASEESTATVEVHFKKTYTTIVWEKGD